jgi:ATP synthase F1 delta subunit
MPAIYRIRADFEVLYDKTNKLLPVQVTSAIELDAETIESLGRRIGEQTGNEIELSSTVDPEILGGIVLRVGNFILDASIRTRLEQLRREVAQA